MFNNIENMKVFWHSSSHVLAQAIKRLYPEAKLAIGPSIDNGYYYDIDLELPITLDMLQNLELEMKKIIKENYKIEKFILSKNEAIKLMEERDEPYKIELIKDIPSHEDISFYKQGEFIDLCSGPHLNSTGEIKVIKLLSIAGAYWRGNEKNKMLQRIYGISFEKEEELQEYLDKVKEAKNRDHRKLGKELDLFSVDDYVGPGLVLWHPKLSVVREEIEMYWRKEHRKRGYQYVYTPQVGLSNLWETSGHLDHFADGMYPPMAMSLKDSEENVSYYVKPMSCPFHVRIYKSRKRSYRELPMRLCELGTVYRYEKSGALHGMLRVRGFTQDDAHVICREDQFVNEVNQIIDFALEMNKVMGFDKLNVYFSVRDPENKEKFIDNEKVWVLAETTLENILKERNIEYKKDIGGAKFYGPAIDMKAVDAMGREWQGTTIQLDMNLPSKFQMAYIGEDGQEHVPIMLHRTLLGSMERFVGTLIEHYAGAFPLWLSPVQVKILTVNEECIERAEELEKELHSQGIRVELDSSAERIGYKIRSSQLEKVPYMIVIGKKEVESGMISVRSRKNGDLGVINPKLFIHKILEEIETKER
ncbi:threonine--tRNA ligase [Clostridium sp. OS1-26]|uniref:threonine--tRNA ligase n=1 Tax=Clostridium sp. OS1-26 TaxID=3070681 RepID=UPI0027E0BC38|nr:threonine--tRNA ligase [Clostridium sp. OS1-26]WML32588.1 threonine--tRNA ligase [Clostridium sp. OS1-26]